MASAARRRRPEARRARHLTRKAPRQACGEAASAEREVGQVRPAGSEAAAPNHTTSHAGRNSIGFATLHPFTRPTPGNRPGRQGHYHMNPSACYRPWLQTSHGRRSDIGLATLHPFTRSTPGFAARFGLHTRASHPPRPPPCRANRPDRLACLPNWPAQRARPVSTRPRCSSHAGRPTRRARPPPRERNLLRLRSTGFLAKPRQPRTVKVSATVVKVPKTTE